MNNIERASGGGCVDTEGHLSCYDPWSTRSAWRQLKARPEKQGRPTGLISSQSFLFFLAALHGMWILVPWPGIKLPLARPMRKTDRKVFLCFKAERGFPGSSVVKNPPAMRRCGFNLWVRKISWRMECILAWEIPWTEEPSGLQSMGLQKSWTYWLNNKAQESYQENEVLRG